MIKITQENFNLEEEFMKINSKNNGAYSFFLGTVRNDLTKNEKDIDGIFLECFEELAYKQLSTIRDKAIQQWDLNNCSIIHRIGKLNMGEKIVLVLTSSAHRANAIKACEYIIDNLKINVTLTNNSDNNLNNLDEQKEFMQNMLIYNLKDLNSFVNSKNSFENLSIFTYYPYKLFQEVLYE